MESNIAKKLQLLNYEQDKYPMINKFMITLSDELISLEETEQIIAYLATKGIVLNKPSQQNVMLNGLDFIISQVEKMESLGALGAYIEDPSRINCKSAAQRVEYLLSQGESIATPEGKYSKLPFRKRAFESKYGIAYIEPAPVLNSDVINPEMDTPIIEPVVPSWSEEPVIVDKIVAENSLSGLEETVIPEEEVVTFTNPIDEILSKPQTIGLNDETFERYEKLAESIRRILVSVYGIEEINESITDNLIKLITSDVNHEMRNNDIMYYAITWGKTITDEEIRRLNIAITEELEYTSILELDMGRVA